MGWVPLLFVRVWTDGCGEVVLDGGVRGEQGRGVCMQGIVPISCEEIFTRIAANEDKNKEYEVMVSMMEIYNEKVQDLLIPINKRPPEGHKIREHKTLGIYV